MFIYLCKINLKKSSNGLLKTTTPISVLRKKFGKYAMFTEKNGRIIMQSKPDYSTRKYTDNQCVTWQRLKDAQQNDQDNFR